MSRDAFMDETGASLTTFKRDLEYMRDRFNAPVVWDRERGGYRYDGRWRPERARGMTAPAGVKPVVRFRNPDDGEVGWNDLVKGPIAFSNTELDDLKR